MKKPCSKTLSSSILFLRSSSSSVKFAGHGVNRIRVGTATLYLTMELEGLGGCCCHGAARAHFDNKRPRDFVTLAETVGSRSDGSHRFNIVPQARSTWKTKDDNNYQPQLAR
jgi:hypothetical protein